MARIRRGGFIFTTYIGDPHTPKHVHVNQDDGKFVGRLDLELKVGLEDWTPTRKLLDIVEQLQAEGRL